MGKRLSPETLRCDRIEALLVTFLFSVRRSSPTESRKRGMESRGKQNKLQESLINFEF